ncbi:hypothetical protein MTP99_001704 [Tenebrio molitor]|jgi:hypothetical protein|nr:hypothetical protein MTP99_001704 [Tenebrio molitor]CAH1365440.1 unnamed protein product [Tenebrio molitor]
MFERFQSNFCDKMNHQQMFQKLCAKPKFPSPTKSDTSPAAESGVFSGANLAGEEPPSMVQAREELEVSMDVKRIAKEVEDYVKNRRMTFEEKMFEKFYVMRIEQSRKFIDLIRKINKSWDDFVDYLKSIGAQGGSGDGDCTVYSLTNSSSLTALSQVTNDSK